MLALKKVAERQSKVRGSERSEDDGLGQPIPLPSHTLSQAQGKDQF